jgi:hypothetical protein
MLIKRNENEGILSWINRGMTEFRNFSGGEPKKLIMNSTNINELRTRLGQEELFDQFKSEPEIILGMQLNGNDFVKIDQLQIRG